MRRFVGHLRAIRFGVQGAIAPWALTIVAVIAAAGVAAAQDLPGAAAAASAQPTDMSMAAQWAEVWVAAARLPLAAGLAALLALRPRRKGTPNRDMGVIHTQIILAVVGTLVMLVVGSSLARAFGIVGAAGLVRYRAKVEHPKDAGVMLSTLAVGLACGVGQWLLAIFGTVFLIALLWIVESFEPASTTTLVIKARSKDTAGLRTRIERLLARYGAGSEVRAMSPEELQIEVRWPIDRPTDRLAERLVKLDPEGSVELEVVQKKD
jgi:hypothetical protein